MHRPVLLLLVVVLSLPVAAVARRHDPLLSVVSPTAKETVYAHPFVNVAVRFERPTSCLGSVNLRTFHARIGRSDVTDLFEDETVNGQVVGARARIGVTLLRLGRMNHLRFTVKTKGCREPGGHSRILSDRARVRFLVDSQDDQPPVAVPHAETAVVLPHIAVQFDGTQSTDVEGDPLTYRWDFGDGTTTEGATVTHAYGDGTGDVTVTLVVNDGQKDSVPVTLRLPEVPPLTTPGGTPGVLSITAAGTLEFGGVAVGTSATRTFTITNTDPTPTSELPVLFAVEHPFSLPAVVAPAATQLDLGPGESAEVTLTFSPTATGHQQGVVTVVANATNRKAVELLAHGYGGTAPGTGPTLAAETLYYIQYVREKLGFATFGIQPDGTRFFADNTVHTCQTSGLGNGDLCVTDDDCAANHGTCNQGAKALFEPVTSAGRGMCGDGEGGLYLLSDSGTFTDPTPNPLTERDASLLHLTFDGSGARTRVEMVSRIFTQTQAIACDHLPAAEGGRVYMAEYHNINSPGNCFRDSREALVALNKSNGNESTLIDRIDKVEGLDNCNDDFDQLTDLEVARDGSQAFVSFSTGTGTDNGALWLVRPTPSYILHDLDDNFAVHPDGAILYALASDVGTRGVISLYKISPDQAAAGALRIQNLTPCATFELPNNRPVGVTGRRTVITGPLAAGVATAGSTDATVFVNVASSSASIGSPPPLAPVLDVKATVAFSSPAGSSACTPLGVQNLEFLDQLAF